MNYDSLELHVFGQYAEVRAVRKDKREYVKLLGNTPAIGIRNKSLE